MKFQKPKNVEKDLALVGGLAVGSMVSKGIYGFIPGQTSTTIIMATRGALALALGATGMFVSGQDTGANLVRGAAFGAAVTQVLEIVKEVSANAGVKNESESDGQIGKFVARMVGLGCPEGVASYPAIPMENTHSLNGWSGRALNGNVGTLPELSTEDYWKKALQASI
jgi:hypothetical protein